MAFAGRVPLQSGADLSALLGFGMPLVSVTIDGVPARGLQMGPLQPPSAGVWPRVLVPWRSWAPGWIVVDLVGNAAIGVESEWSIRFMEFAR